MSDVTELYIVGYNFGMTCRCHVYNGTIGVKGAEMRIDRLIGILSILLQKERVTAPTLAEQFEVSRRTINRDIEELG